MQVLPSVSTESRTKPAPPRIGWRPREPTGFRAQVPDGSRRAGFIPSGLIWLAAGCWQVTGTVAGRSLTFVTRVKASGS